MAYAENQVTIEIVNDGFSPIVEVDQSDNAATITVTDVTGTKTDVVRKRQVFVTEPTTPYSVGDLWVTAGGDQEIVDSLITDEGDFIIDSAEQFFEVLTKGVAVYVCMTSRPSGAFVESDWSLAATDNTSVNELREWFWHDANGAHVLGDETGFRNDITSTGMKIVDTSDETSVAEFGAGGATVGKAGAAHSVIDASGQRFYGGDGTKLLAHIGYDPNIGTGSTFYTFGTRNQSYSIGGRSLCEGTNTGAEGSGSHAEGIGTASLSDAAHAEGENTTAGYNGNIGEAAHAEGGLTTASGDASHAEGMGTAASGAASHAGGYYTKASSDYQTVIGKWNIEDNADTYGFIVGNGTADDAQSNAFAVDWNGNIYPKNTKMVDFVTAEDDDSGWTFRKWKSGFIEAWFSGSVTSATGATEISAPIYQGSWSLSIPSAVGFASAPKLLIGNNYNATRVISIEGEATSATAISGKFWRVEPQSGTIELYPRIYAWGVAS